MIPPGLFVVGTDTGVGKTFVSSAVIRALRAEGRRVGAIKPVATGAEPSGNDLRSDDVECLVSALGGPPPRDRVCPFLYREPLAPPVAARRAGSPLSREALEEGVADAIDWWSGRADVLVIEGVGGLLCPIAEGTTVADLAVAVDYPLLIVARRALGTLNHTLLTVEAAERRGLRIAGVVLNGAGPTEDATVEESNAEELSRHLRGVSILPDLPHDADGSAWAVAPTVAPWYVRCTPPRYISLPGPSRSPAHGVE